jgi:hypothetical protein
MSRNVEDSIDINDDPEIESTSFNGIKGDRKPSGDDPISDWLMKTYYWIMSDRMKMIRLGAYFSPILLIFLFSIFISNSTSNLIAFSALVISLVFIVISMWLLCWILEKDPGTR